MRELVRGFIRGFRAAGYRVGKAVLRGLGYDVHLVRSYGQEDAIGEGVEDGHLYRKWSTDTTMWMPWLGDDAFRATFEGVAPHTVVSSDRCYTLFSLASQVRSLDGDFAECGVFNGGTALLIARSMAGTDRKLFLFDSFEGLPEPDRAKDPGFEAGDFKSASEKAVGKLLSEHQEAVDIRAGWIPETFDGLEDHRFAFVHIDVDLYQSTIDCCEFFYPRLAAGGAMVFDDYGFPDTRGMRVAVEEFFADRPERPFALPTGQAIVTKLPNAEAAP